MATRESKARRPVASRIREDRDAAAAAPLLDRQWHLASDATEVAVTEAEFALHRVAAAFVRWQADCIACCHDQSFSGTENAVLHVIRMHDRPKPIGEIARMLRRDDLANLQYGVRKLAAAGLVERVGGTSRRDARYRVTELGRAVTDRYAATRRELLLGALRAALGSGARLQRATRALDALTACYDRAAERAAAHQLPRSARVRA